MKKKKSIKLYNVLFPVWMLLLFPIVWLVVLPGNFIIDSLVLILTLKALNFTEIKTYYKKCILKVFIFGLASDFVGALFMMLMLFLEISQMGDEFYLTIPAIIISAILIFTFDYFISFRKVEKMARFKLSLTFAITTAPYTFLIPTSWLY